VDGLAVVDKEAGWTSHDVVAKARGILRTRKIGHAGTLDPDATGVLLLGVGRVTRLLRFLTELPKTYTATIVLGVETSTLDASGEVLATHDMASVTADDVRAAARALTGEILQVPPMVSAVKVGGRRLHELARQGIEVERRHRPVTVHRFEVTPTDDARWWRATVVCSSGTYVRTLAADLGAALGGGAHLRDLRRTAVGSFSDIDAVPIDRLSPDVLLTPAEAVRDLVQVVVDDDVARAVGFGKVLPVGTLGAPGGTDGPWAVVDAAGRLLAVYERHVAAGPDAAKPAVVVAAAGSGSSGDDAHG
jgi:tRNA pseudouridine55 synthase